MILPETAEAVWLSKLADLPRFDPGDKEIVVISPHPDDETLGAGGLIASHCDSGHAVTIVAVTDGEHAYTDVPDLAVIRVREQEEAVRCLSQGRARLVRLGLTDSGISAQEKELLRLLLQIVRPDAHIIAPWTGDFHPDHEVCGRAAAEVARLTGARLSWYFFWTWHRGTPSTVKDLPLRSFSFGEALQEQKWGALLRHQSQLEHPSGEPILSGRLLAPARRNFEVFAES